MMKVKDKLALQGIDGEKLSLRELFSHVQKEIDQFDEKKEQVANDLAALLAFSEVSRTELAEALSWKKSRISKVLSGNENLTLKTISEIVEKIDYDFDIIFRKKVNAPALQPWFVNHEADTNSAQKISEIAQHHLDMFNKQQKSLTELKFKPQRSNIFKSEAHENGQPFAASA